MTMKCSVCGELLTTDEASFMKELADRDNDAGYWFGAGCICAKCHAAEERGEAASLWAAESGAGLEKLRDCFAEDH